MRDEHDPFAPFLQAARIRLHADIDHACALEQQRGREAAEHAQRSLGQLFAWSFVRRRGQ